MKLIAAVSMAAVRSVFFVFFIFNPSQARKIGYVQFAVLGLPLHGAVHLIDLPDELLRHHLLGGAVGHDLTVFQHVDIGTVHKGQVQVVERQEGDILHLELSVAPEDMGKVIGKQGRIAKAIRSVMKACAAKKNVKVVVDII